MTHEIAKRIDEGEDPFKVVSEYDDGELDAAYEDAHDWGGTFVAFWLGYVRGQREFVAKWREIKRQLGADDA